MGQIVEAGSIQLDNQEKVVPAGSIELDRPVMGDVQRFLPDLYRRFVPDITKYAVASEQTMIDDTPLWEAKGAVLSGAFSWIPAGWSFFGGSGMPEAPIEDPSLIKSAEIAKTIQGAFTYDPKSDEGKKIAEEVARATGIPQLAEMGYGSQEYWYKLADEATANGNDTTSSLYRIMGLAAGVGGESTPFIIGGAIKPLVRPLKGLAEKISELPKREVTAGLSEGQQGFLDEVAQHLKPGQEIPWMLKEQAGGPVKGVGAKAKGATGETPTDIMQLTESLKELNSDEFPLIDRVKQAVKIADTVQSGKDVLINGLNKLKLVGETLYNDIKSGELGKPKEVSDFAKAREEYVGSYQISNFEAKKFGATIRKEIPDALKREAIVNYIQADGDPGLLKRQFEQSTLNTATTKYAAGYKAAMELKGNERVFADNVRNYFDSKLQQGIESGLLEQGLTDYVNQIWEKENPVTSKLKSDIAYGRLQPNPSLIRKRLLEDYFMGEQLGFKPRSKDIGYLLTAYDQAMNKAIASRAFIKSLSDAKAGDGRPVVGVSGAGKQIEGAIDEKSPYLIRPKVKGDDLADYKVVDHPALRKWKWVGSDESGNPMLMQGDLLVHLESFTDLNNMLKTSAVRQNPIGRAALKTVATLKGTLLSLSGFHQTQVGLHAVFHGVNPFNTPKIDFSNPFHEAMAKHGLIVADYKNMELFHEGITSGGLIGKIPGLGPLTQKYTDWLFTDYIPRLKMKMAQEAYNRNVARYGDKFSDDQIKSITADQANAAFGELNYAKMGRNPTTQDALRLMLLAPDFFEARARFVGQALRPYAGVPELLKSPTMNEQGMAAILRGGLGLYVGARIVNGLLNDGDTHTDKPFSVVIKDREFSLRSIPGDVYHLINDPRSFVFHRLNPTITQPLIKAMLRRDDLGHYLTAEDWVKDFFLSHTPIPGQGLAKGQKTIWESLLGSIGVSAFKYRTDFERALMEESSKFSVTTLSREDRERNKIISRYVDDLQSSIKSGDNTKFNEAMNGIEKDIGSGKLYMEDATKITDYATSDRIGRYLKSLPVERILPLWKKASSDEQMNYLPALVDKIVLLSNSHPEKFAQLMPQIEKLFQGKAIPKSTVTE